MSLEPRLVEYDEIRKWMSQSLHLVGRTAWMPFLIIVVGAPVAWGIDFIFGGVSLIFGLPAALVCHMAAIKWIMRVDRHDMTGNSTIVPTSAENIKELAVGTGNVAVGILISLVVFTLVIVVVGSVATVGQESQFLSEEEVFKTEPRHLSEYEQALQAASSVERFVAEAVTSFAIASFLILVGLMCSGTGCMVPLNIRGLSISEAAMCSRRGVLRNYDVYREVIKRVGGINLMLVPMTLLFLSMPEFIVKIFDFQIALVLSVILVAVVAHWGAAGWYVAYRSIFLGKRKNSEEEVSSHAMSGDLSKAS